MCHLYTLEKYGTQTLRNSAYFSLYTFAQDADLSANAVPISDQIFQ